MSIQRARAALPVLFGGGAAFTGAYDGVETDLAHAYGMRRMLASYTGNLLRLRRGSDNAESDFGADADGHLDTAAITTWLGGASGYIVTLYDQKGSDDVTQATTDNQPLYVASGQNSRPVMRLDGSNDHLRGAWSAGITAPLASLAVLKIDSAAAVDYAYDSDDDTNRMALLYNGGNYALVGSSQVTTGTVDTSWHVTVAQWANPNTTFHVDGDGGTTLGCGAENPDGITIGASRTAALPFDGDISEVLVWSDNLSGAGLATAESAAADYWGITLA